MRIEVTIPGVPPRKDVGHMMWGRSSDLPRLKLLRRIVKEQITTEEPPEGRVALSLRVFAEISEGDLDNFVGGVCDGLMPALPNVPSVLRDWPGEPPEIGPERPIAFTDDKWVSRIFAERLPVDAEGIRYELAIEWIVP
jgi:hypothetical protein